MMHLKLWVVGMVLGIFVLIGASMPVKSGILPFLALLIVLFLSFQAALEIASGSPRERHAHIKAAVPRQH